MRNILLLSLVLSACSPGYENNQFKKLLDYEGKYEYTGGSTLILQASEFDTTLYAIIDHARYPLNYITAGMSIEEFAKENLFDPMGITNYSWRFAPDRSSLKTFSQMYITPRDLVKLALMFKDGGKWQGRTIIPEDWVRKTFNTGNGDYGYLWYNKYFIVDGKRYDSYMASGNGGQKINIWPELNMITVFTGGNYNSYQLYGKSTAPNEMIPEFIIKALE